MPVNDHLLGMVTDCSPAWNLIDTIGMLLTYDHDRRLLEGWHPAG